MKIIKYYIYIFLVISMPLFAQDISRKTENDYLKIINSNINYSKKIFAYYEVGNLAFLNKEYDKALYYFSKTLKNLNQKEIKKDVLFKLFKIYKAKKEYDKAAIYKKDFINLTYLQEKNLRNTTAYLDDMLELSFLYDKINNDKNSLNIMTQLNTEIEKSKEIRFYLALKYYSLKNFDKAIFFLKKLCDTAVENNTFYTHYLTEVCNIEDIYEKNLSVLKINNLELQNTDVYYRVANYCDVLKESFIKVKAKVIIRTRNLKINLIVNICYSKDKIGSIKIYTSNNLLIGVFYISNKKIYTNEDFSELFQRNEEFDILQQFFDVFDLDSTKLIFYMKNKKGFMFNLDNYVLVTDRKGNVKSIETENTKIEFEKTKFGFILPSKIEMKKSLEFLKINFLNFEYSFDQKENFDKEVFELNESKCKCKD